MNRIVPAFLMATALVGGSANAAEYSGETTRYTIGFTGIVPTICRASLDANVVPAGGRETSLGQLNEFCNSPNGYQIFVETSPELADATLIVDGQTVSLAGNGPVLVAASDGPNILSRNVSLSSPNGAGGSLSFRIVAL